MEPDSEDNEVSRLEAQLALVSTKLEDQKALSECLQHQVQEDKATIQALNQQLTDMYNEHDIEVMRLNDELQRSKGTTPQPASNDASREPKLDLSLLDLEAQVNALQREAFVLRRRVTGLEATAPSLGTELPQKAWEKQAGIWAGALSKADMLLQQLRSFPYRFEPARVASESEDKNERLSPVKLAHLDIPEVLAFHSSRVLYRQQIVKALRGLESTLYLLNSICLFIMILNDEEDSPGDYAAKRGELSKYAMLFKDNLRYLDCDSSEVEQEFQTIEGFLSVEEKKEADVESFESFRQLLDKLKENVGLRVASKLRQFSAVVKEGWGDFCRSALVSAGQSHGPTSVDLVENEEVESLTRELDEKTSLICDLHHEIDSAQDLKILHSKLLENYAEKIALVQDQSCRMSAEIHTAVSRQRTLIEYLPKFRQVSCWNIGEINKNFFSRQYGIDEHIEDILRNLQSDAADTCTEASIYQNVLNCIDIFNKLSIFLEITEEFFESSKNCRDQFFENFESVTSSFEVINSQLSELLEESYAQNRTLRRENQHAERAIRQSQEDVQNLNNELDDKERQVTLLDNQSRSQVEEIENVKVQLSEAIVKYDEINEEIFCVIQDHDNLALLADGLKSDVDKLVGEKSTLEKELNLEISKAHTLQSQLEEKHSFMIQRADTISELEKENCSLKANVQILETSLENLYKTNVELNTIKESSENQVRELLEANSLLQANSNAEQTLRMSLEKQFEEKNETLRLCKLDIEQLKETLHISEKDRNNLRESLKELKENFAKEYCHLDEMLMLSKKRENQIRDDLDAALSKRDDVNKCLQRLFEDQRKIGSRLVALSREFASRVRRDTVAQWEKNSEALGALQKKLETFGDYLGSLRFGEVPKLLEEAWQNLEQSLEALAEEVKSLHVRQALLVRETEALRLNRDQYAGQLEAAVSAMEEVADRLELPTLAAPLHLAIPSLVERLHQRLQYEQISCKECGQPMSESVHYRRRMQTQVPSQRLTASLRPSKSSSDISTTLRRSQRREGPTIPFIPGLRRTLSESFELENLRDREAQTSFEYSPAERRERRRYFPPLAMEQFEVGEPVNPVSNACGIQ